MQAPPLPGRQYKGGATLSRSLITRMTAGSQLPYRIISLSSEGIQL